MQPSDAAPYAIPKPNIDLSLRSRRTGTVWLGPAAAGGRQITTPATAEARRLQARGNRVGDRGDAVAHRQRQRREDRRPAATSAPTTRPWATRVDAHAAAAPAPRERVREEVGRGKPHGFTTVSADANAIDAAHRNHVSAAVFCTPSCRSAVPALARPQQLRRDRHLAGVVPATRPAPCHLRPGRRNARRCRASTWNSWAAPKAFPGPVESSGKFDTWIQATMRPRRVANAGLPARPPPARAPHRRRLISSVQVGGEVEE